jgi:NAD(P)-dependent dehydrogenase (short-subunit alcohol dehydrogenase family)
VSYLESLFSLAGDVAVVTGAARGNGRAMARALAEAGASVVLTDVLGDALSDTCGALAAEGLQISEVTADLTDDSAAETIIGFALRRYGRVDVLVNSAGISRPHATLEYPDASWDATYAVNLRAPFRLSRAAARVMRESGRGSIINVTSLNAELGFPDNPAYVAFKGALKQLTKSLAVDLGVYGIRVNSIGPGYFRTDMTKQSYADPELRRQRAGRTALGRWGEPEDLAGAVIYLASGASAYVTGQDLYVDGGWLARGL